MRITLHDGNIRRIDEAGMKKLRPQYDSVVSCRSLPLTCQPARGERGTLRRRAV